MADDRAAVMALGRGVLAAMGGADGLERAKAMPLFRGRLSDKLAEKLVLAGISAPEHLLFMSRAEVHAIKGVGKAGLEEIAAYRAKYVPPDRMGA